MPPRKSRYSRPSESYRRQPLPRVNTTGGRRYVFIRKRVSSLRIFAGEIRAAGFFVFAMVIAQLPAWISPRDRPAAAHASRERARRLQRRAERATACPQRYVPRRLLPPERVSP